VFRTRMANFSRIIVILFLSDPKETGSFFSLVPKLVTRRFFYPASRTVDALSQLFVFPLAAPDDRPPLQVVVLAVQLIPICFFF